MTNALSAKFHLDPQDLDAPTLFAPDRDAVTAWPGRLPTPNPEQSTRAPFATKAAANDSGFENPWDALRTPPRISVRRAETPR